MDPQPLSRYNNEVTPELERIVSKAISRDVETRYQSAADMMADFESTPIFHQRCDSGTIVGRANGCFRFDTTIASNHGAFRRSQSAVLAILALGYFSRSMFAPSKAQSAVAVLPFVNTSQDPETEYLSDGVTESLISRLSALSGLKVMSHLSVSRFKESELDPQSIGRQLGVSTILVGHVGFETEQTGRRSRAAQRR